MFFTDREVIVNLTRRLWVLVTALYEVKDFFQTTQEELMQFSLVQQDHSPAAFGELWGFPRSSTGAQWQSFSERWEASYSSVAPRGGSPPGPHSGYKEVTVSKQLVSETLFCRAAVSLWNTQLLNIKGMKTQRDQQTGAADVWGKLKSSWKSTIKRNKNKKHFSAFKNKEVSSVLWQPVEKKQQTKLCLCDEHGRRRMFYYCEIMLLKSWQWSWSSICLIF